MNLFSFDNVFLIVENAIANGKKYNGQELIGKDTTVALDVHFDTLFWSNSEIE